MGPDASLTPELIQAQSFTSNFRGYDPSEVRSFLNRVATELRAWRERAEQLESAWHSAEERAARPPVLDEDTLMAAVGEETATILRTARAAAADMRSKAADESEKALSEARSEAERLVSEARTSSEETLSAARSEAERLITEARTESEKTRSDARDEADKLLSEARSESERLTTQAREEAERLHTAAHDAATRTAAAAEDAAARLMSGARSEAAEILEKSRMEAEAVRASAEKDRQLTIEGANSTRDRILEDLSRRRRIAIVQIEQLRAGRERLIESYAVVRRTLEEASSELSRADTEARTAAVEAGRRLEREAELPWSDVPDPTPVLLSETGSAAALPGSDEREADEPEPEPEQEPVAEGPQGAGTGAVAEPDAPAEQPAAEQPAAEQPAAEQPAAEEPVTEEPTAEQLTAEEPVTEESAAEQALADEEPVTEEPTAEELTAEQPAVEEMAAEAPAADTEPEPEPAPAEGATPSVVDAAAVQDTVGTGVEPEAQAETDASGSVATGQAGSAVDELFARIRSTRAPRAVAAEEEPPSESADEEDADGEDEEQRLSDADESLLQRRESAVVDLEVTLTRKLKRALQDEQNDLLDRLRNLREEPTAERLLPEVEPQTARYVRAARPLLVKAARAGIDFAGEVLGGSDVSSSHVDTEVDDLADETGAGIVEPLRRRLEQAVARNAGEDQAVLVEALGAAYREWKTQRIERLAGDVLSAAFSRGTWQAVPDGAAMRWIVEDTDGPCPDCDDDALAGDLPKGEPFPTGQHHPPAHSGCRCLLVPVPAAE